MHTTAVSFLAQSHTVQGLSMNAYTFMYIFIPYTPCILAIASFIAYCRCCPNLPVLTRFGTSLGPQ